MTKHIEPKTANQGTALATATLALPPLVIEGFEEFKGSFDRLCLQASAAASAAARRCRTGASQLDRDPEGGPSVALGVQPDADRGGDAQVCTVGTAAGRRSGRPSQARHDKILGLAAICGAEH